MGIKISVIIASLNCGSIIGQAICSFLGQDYADKELIVIDGGSSEDTMRVIRRYRDRIDVLVSEKDRGVYDAYNKGVLRSSGDYVVFLGADDSFYDRHSLRRAAELIAKRRMPDLLCTQILYLDRGWAYVEKKTVLYSLREGIRRNQPMIPHQGLFTKRSILKEHPFSLSYEICSDFEFYLYCCKAKKRIEYADVVSAYFDRQGLSSGNVRKRQREEEHILSVYGERIPSGIRISWIRKGLRKWVQRTYPGTMLLVGAGGYRIHKCTNPHCRWCAVNRRKLGNRRRTAVWQ